MLRTCPKPLLASLVFILSLAGPAVSSGPLATVRDPRDLAEQLDAFVARYAEQGLFNGVVLVAERGRVVTSKAYGFANIEWEVPNTPETKFRIASITKQFTAMLVLRQVEANRIRLNATISDYLPEYPAANGRKITIHQLLNHTCGIPEYTDTADLIDAQVPSRPEEFVRRFDGLPLLFEPGSQYSYSNAGYYVLGVILERVTGRGYEQLLHDEILDPLGMRDTGYDHVQDVMPKRATGYLRLITPRENSRYRYVEPGRTAAYRTSTRYELPIYRDLVTLYAAGAMYSTARDLHTWDRALAAGTLVSPELARMYVRPGLGNYAYGWFVAKPELDEIGDFLRDFEHFKPRAPGKGEGIGIQFHSGSVNGFLTSIVRVPERDQLIVVLNNTGMTRLADINAGLLQILNGRPAPPVRRSIAESVARALVDDGPEAGRRVFHDMTARDDDQQFLNVAELTGVSRALTGMGRPGDAAVLLELGLTSFPRSSRCMDALARAYADAGNVERARATTQSLLAGLAADTALGRGERDELRRTAENRLRSLGAAAPALASAGATAGGVGASR